MFPPGYASAPYEDVNHVMNVAAAVFTGGSLETNPRVLESLPVNLCIARGLVAWGSQFDARAWLSRNWVRVSSRSFRLRFYEPCDHELSKLKHSEPFGGVVAVDADRNVIAAIPTIISWSDEVTLVSFKYGNRWNTGRLGRAFSESSKGAVWHLRSAFLDNKENVHHHEVFDDAKKCPPGEYQDLFFHAYQVRAARSYKNLCGAVAGHVFERAALSETPDIPTPDMIYKTTRGVGVHMPPPALGFGSPVKPIAFGGGVL